MPNPRQAIRAAIVSGLAAHPSILALVPAAPVESSRMIPLSDAKLPRILVYIRGETAPGFVTKAPRVYQILATLVVEYVSRVKVTDGPPEDELDTISGALETALDTLETSRVGDLVRSMVYKSTAISLNHEGERATASIALEYEIEYGRIVAPVVVDDFLTTETEYLAGDVSPDDNPTDSVTLPQ